MTILVVEDDEDISALLRRGFENEGYAVDCAGSGEEGLERARTTQYKTIILDVMLPGCDGLDVCSRLRKNGHEATIIMLSARDTVTDRIEGLSFGADDYVVKPFDFGELIARVRAHERRNVSPADGDESTLSALGFRYDPVLRELSYEDQGTALTEREGDLLMLFMRHIGKPLSRKEIFDALWEGQGGSAVNVVDVYVGYLRRKFATFGLEPKSIIKTVRGLGFMMPRAQVKSRAYPDMP